MNFYSASVALLWSTAFRAGAVPAVSRQSYCQAMTRKGKARVRPVREASGGASRESRARSC